MMNYNTIESYVERVYGFAVNHTFTRDEADELSQEILITAVRELPRLKDRSKFEPWLWGIAGNTAKSFRRRMGKQRAMYSYNVPEDLFRSEQCNDPEENQEEEYDRLRTNIAMLSAIYRDIIILHYYDGLSTKQISDRLNIPEGTITWRLSEARKKLKKEYNNMNETALRPVKLRIDIYGSGDYDGEIIPFPSEKIDDALSQNILYYCYEKPCGIEELAQLCGVPAYYIEDRIRNLLKREALLETSKGKYRTSFIIWSDKYGIYCEEHGEKALLPLMNQLLEALHGIAREAAGLGFYKAGKSETDLFYLYGSMAFCHASTRYCTLPYPDYVQRYDGGRWCYIGNMETGQHRRIGLGIQCCTNNGIPGGYTHTSYGGIHGMAFRPMMRDYYINICADILRGASPKDTESVANAIREGYIIKKQDGTLLVTTPAFTRKQKAAFNSITDKYLAPLMPAYSEIINDFIAGYKKLFPPHLNDDADRMCQNMFQGFYTVVVEHAQRIGAIKMPSPHCFCDVLIQTAPADPDPLP